MAWSQGAALTDIMTKLQKRTSVPYVTPGSQQVLPKVGQDAASVDEQHAKDTSSAFERLGVVDNMSKDVYSSGPSDYLQKAEDIMFRANQVQQQANMTRLRNSMSQYQGAVKGMGNGGGKLIIDGIPGGAVTNKGQLGQFLRAISHKESGGNYGARNSSSGAMGKYQIMPANIQGPGGWDKEALGRNITTQQFMSTPKLQEAIAQYKLTQYFRKYGAAGAASAWYSGSPTKWKTSYGGQGAYPSIHNYVTSILRAMGM